MERIVTLCFLILCWTTPTVISVEVIPVPDGVIVKDRGELKQISSQVETYIEIPRDVSFQNKQLFGRVVDNLMDLLNNLTGMVSSAVDPQVITSLKWRVLKISSRLGLSDRKRRGLFNFVGEISKSLFGTATSNDIEKLRKAHRNLEVNQQAIVQHQNKLIGVVQQLQDVQRNHYRILTSLQDQVSRLSSFATAVSEGLTILGQVMDAEVMVSALESVRDEVERARILARVKINLCQSGSVTEELIPSEFLSQLVHVSQYGHYLPEQWYYMYPRVTRYFEYLNRVYCVTNLPLIHQDVYLSKRIYTYPVKKNGTIIRVLHDTWIALSTTNGDLFYPNLDLCVGYNPTVCQAGMIFPVSQESCVRGIVGADNSLKQSCSIQVSELDLEHKVITTGQNTYVVYTKQGVLTERCSKNLPTYINLEEGIFVVKIKPGCSLENGDWRLEGVHYLSRTVNDTMTDGLTFPDFPHLADTLIGAWKTHLSLSPQQTIVVKEPTLDVPPTYQPSYPELTWTPTSTQTVLYALAIIISLISIGGIIYCILCGCPKCCKCWQPINNQLSGQTPSTIEIVKYDKSTDNVTFEESAE